MADSKQKLLAQLHELHSKLDLCNRLVGGVVASGENLLRCGSALTLLDEADELIAEIINDNYWN